MPANSPVWVPAKSASTAALPSFPYTETADGPVKIIAGANGCMDLPRTRVMPALLAAATFRICVIMKRGRMRQRISPGSDYADRGAGMDVAMTPGMALEDLWI
jgi:hypothetical protein